MGFFSWLTADTQESIGNIYSNKHRAGGVYLLCPDGTKIHEPSYEGYGKFGGKDAYVLLARQNAEKLGVTLNSDEEAFDLGVALEVGYVYIHSQTNEIWHIFHTDAHSVLGGKIVKERFCDPIPELGMSANEAIHEGILVPTEVSALVDFLPLVFSFNPDAEYEHLEASEPCPEQGYFYS